MKGNPQGSACKVCGAVDARSLSKTTLADGSRVLVCGSHALSHRRAGRTARTVAELVSLTGERRAGGERRGEADDELAGMLAEAFAPRPRRGGERRGSG